ncbi:MAG TPA: hypothetical protein VD835_03335 [Pyrinomonadaceae bacterium]|nr:hypothetical protein [Pyrinomonadaceae bacterium]
MKQTKDRLAKAEESVERAASFIRKLEGLIIHVAVLLSTLILLSGLILAKLHTLFW